MGRSRVQLIVLDTELDSKPCNVGISINSELYQHDSYLVDCATRNFIFTDNLFPAAFRQRPVRTRHQAQSVQQVVIGGFGELADLRVATLPLQQFS